MVGSQLEREVWRWEGTEPPGPDTPVRVPAQKTSPFYEEWWFLVVIALVGLIFILLLVFVLIIRGQSKKFAKKTDSGELAPSPTGWAGRSQVGLPFGKGGVGVSLSWKRPCSGQLGSPGFHTLSPCPLGVNSLTRERADSPARWGR